jgi:Rieske Fe-S protein
MTSSSPETTRRVWLVKVGLLFNGAVGIVLAVPILRYLLSPVVRAKKGLDESWVSLGKLEKFPSGETRLATFRNPVEAPTDGTTADIPCWVRNIDGQNFQVFAINCMHLGCPVRWFPQSNLFMCPCHGGVYYEDGARAAGPPVRGLVQYPHKTIDGELHIRAGQLPTPGSPHALIQLRRKSQCV